VLALGSPTHPLPDGTWAEWAKTYKWDRFHDQEFVQFAPLFGHQYSHAWVDFRGIRDPYMRDAAREDPAIDYFENSRRATLSQRAYATANPGGWRDYGPDAWGLTASDGPLDSTLTGRRARAHLPHLLGARRRHRRAERRRHDRPDRRPAGSIAFAPEVVVPALAAMRRRYGAPLFGRYGFVDAFNPTLRDPAVPVRHGRVVPGVGWFDTDYLGIDQGPILLMLENQRSGLVWRLMRGNPYIARGLCRAGFRGGWLDGRC
jgi:hypothetical protein